MLLTQDSSKEKTNITRLCQWSCLHLSRLETSPHSGWGGRGRGRSGDNRSLTIFIPKRRGFLYYVFFFFSQIACYNLYKLSGGTKWLGLLVSMCPFPMLRDDGWIITCTWPWSLPAEQVRVIPDFLWHQDLLNSWDGSLGKNKKRPHQQRLLCFEPVSLSFPVHYVCWALITLNK